MIFSGNTTALGASTIPMAEGYDTSCGVGLALVEGARNDLAMFQALVQADYKEMAICKESAEVMQEGEISALHEAVGGGIFKKIAELFKKLVAKIKSIFHNFMAKINGLVMKDKDLVKKYQNELARKRNLEKLEVKWRNYSGDFNSMVNELFNVEADFEDVNIDTDWKEDSWDRVKHFIKKADSVSNPDSIDNTSEYIKESIDSVLEDEDTVKLSEIGGWRALASFISDYSSSLKKMESNIRKTTTKLEALVKKYDKEASTAADESVKDKDNAEKTKAVDTANKKYDMAQAYQTFVLADMQANVQIATILYKQNKAAFMKAIAANEKKLEESAVYLDAIAEAAEDEVDNVINSALSDEEISDLSAASTNVVDGDVSDDPDKLTYGPNKYTNDASFDDSEGSIDSCIGGGKVEESAYFGKLFY